MEVVDKYANTCVILYFVLLTVKGCIFHFTMWQIHPSPLKIITYFLQYVLQETIIYVYCLGWSRLLRKIRNNISMRIYVDSITLNHSFRLSKYDEWWVWRPALMQHRINALWSLGHVFMTRGLSDSVIGNLPVYQVRLVIPFITSC